MTDALTQLRERSHRAQQLAQEGLGPQARLLMDQLIEESLQAVVQPHPVTGQLLLDRAWVDRELRRELSAIAGDLSQVQALITALDEVYGEEAIALAERLWRFWSATSGSEQAAATAHELWVQMLNRTLGPDHPRVWQARSLRPQAS